MTNTTIRPVSHISKWIKLLAAIEGIGGILGIGRILMLPNLEEQLVVASFFGFVYGLGILAGWWLWRWERRGFFLSKLLWGVQIPIVMSSLVSWKVTVGFGIPIFLVFSRNRFTVGIWIETSNCLLHHPPQVLLGINLVAVLAVRYLFHVAQAVPWYIGESGSSPDNGEETTHESQSQ